MNDFTKEELKDISSWLSDIHHDSFDDVGYIINKIQSMIDNYCEYTEWVHRPDLPKKDKVKNILCFLIILFGEDLHTMSLLGHFSPNYIIEKYNRYIESALIEHESGIHTNFRTELLDTYCSKWHL